MKLEIVEKAYYVWHDGMIGFGPEIYNSVEETPIIFADSPSQAKVLATEPHDWYLKDTEDYPKYTDLKVRRAKGADLVVFEGKRINRYGIKRILYSRKRESKLKSFLNDPVLTHCYIMKRGEYYRPNSSGYTSMKHKAGIYPIKEGVQDAISCEDLWLERTSKEDHNEMIEKHIKETRKLILN